MKKILIFILSLCSIQLNLFADLKTDLINAKTDLELTEIFRQNGSFDSEYFWDETSLETLKWLEKKYGVELQTNLTIDSDEGYKILDSAIAKQKEKIKNLETQLKPDIIEQLEIELNASQKILNMATQSFSDPKIGYGHESKDTTPIMNDLTKKVKNELIKKYTIKIGKLKSDITKYRQQVKKEILSVTELPQELATLISEY